MKYAAIWKDLGRNLEIDYNVLNIIEKDCPNNCEECCSKMLREWMDITPNASWEMLYNAVDKTNVEISEVSYIVDKLNALVNKLPDAVEKIDTAADVLPDAIDKLFTVADLLPNTVENIDSTVKVLPNVVNQPCDAVNKSVDKLKSTENVAKLSKFTGNYILWNLSLM